MKNNRISQRQLRDLRIELELELTRLERALGRDESQNAFDMSPASTPGAPSGLGVATLNRAQARHDAILEALERIEKGTYGSCASCGDGIPYGRLMVMPETHYCVACGARV